MIRKEISFISNIKRAYKDKSGEMHVVAIASDTKVDCDGERMSEGCIDSFVQQCKAGVDIIDNHRATFAFGKTVEATKEVAEDGSYTLLIDIKLDSKYPQSIDLFQGVFEGKENKQLSIGGWIDADAGVDYELGENGKRVRVINGISLDHIATTRPGQACNERSCFISATLKEALSNVSFDSLKYGNMLLAVQKDNTKSTIVVGVTANGGVTGHFHEYAMLIDETGRVIGETGTPVNSGEGDIHTHTLTTRIKTDINKEHHHLLYTYNLITLDNGKLSFNIFDETLAKECPECLEVWIKKVYKIVKTGNIPSDIEALYKKLSGASTCSKEDIKIRDGYVAGKTLKTNNHSHMFIMDNGIGMTLNRIDHIHLIRNSIILSEKEHSHEITPKVIELTDGNRVMVLTAYKMFDSYIRKNDVIEDEEFIKNLGSLNQLFKEVNLISPVVFNQILNKKLAYCVCPECGFSDEKAMGVEYTECQECGTEMTKSKNSITTELSMNSFIVEFEKQGIDMTWFKELKNNELNKGESKMVTEIVAKTVPSYQDHPVMEGDVAWDRDKADSQLRAWASSDGSGSKEKMDWAKYSKGFFYYDSEKKEDFTGYKLPYVYVEAGSPKVPRSALSAVMTRIRGTDMPDAERTAVYSQVQKYYVKLGLEAPELNSEEAAPSAKKERTGSVLGSILSAFKFGKTEEPTEKNAPSQPAVQPIQPLEATTPAVPVSPVAPVVQPVPAVVVEPVALTTSTAQQVAVKIEPTSPTEPKITSVLDFEGFRNAFQQAMSLALNGQNGNLSELFNAMNIYLKDKEIVESGISEIVKKSVKDSTDSILGKVIPQVASTLTEISKVLDEYRTSTFSVKAELDALKSKVEGLTGGSQQVTDPNDPPAESDEEENTFKGMFDTAQKKASLKRS